MKPKLLIIAVFLIAAGVALAIARSRSAPPDPPAPPEPTVREATTRVEARSGVELTLAYSSEKQAWLEAAVAGYTKAHPDVHVALIGKGSLEGGQAILDGTDHPTVWSPADSLVLSLIAADWQTRHPGAPLYAATERPQPLVLSPLVFVAWDKRAGELSPGGNGRMSWRAIRRAIGDSKGQPGISLGHTDPNKSNSGLGALVGMTYEYFATTSNVTAEQLLAPRFLDYVRDIEHGVPRFEASTGTLMTDMIRFGPSKYDVAVVYESTAVAQLSRAQGRWGNLHIYYPTTTIWSDHPAVVLDAPWVTAAQKAAANDLVRYLRSTPVQETALQFGFRPADDAVPMKSSDASNPFTRNAKYGLSLDLPPAVQAPDPVVVRNLLMLWQRMTKGR